MPAVLTDSEVSSLRSHLGYGAIGVGGSPYTPDGFYEVFNSVISPNLQTGEETTSATTVAVGSATIVVASATDIVANARLVVDVGDLAEVVVVRSVSGTDVTATFAKAHTGTYPVALMSGLTRLRLLLHAADTAWLTLQLPTMASAAGIKRVEGDVEFFGPTGSGASSRLTGTRAHYESIVMSISSLVRVAPLWARDRGGVRQTEVY